MNTEQLKHFIYGGDAIFTVIGKGDRRRTYRVFRSKADKDNLNVKNTVGVLTGPSNMTDYTYFAQIDKEGRYYPIAAATMVGKNLRVTGKERMSYNSDSAIIFRYLLRLVRENKPLPPTMEIMHADLCGRCRKPLTVPKSIERGLGPDCAKKTAGLLRGSGPEPAPEPKREPEPAKPEPVTVRQRWKGASTVTFSSIASQYVFDAIKKTGAKLADVSVEVGLYDRDAYEGPDSEWSKVKTYLIKEQKAASGSLRTSLTAAISRIRAEPAKLEGEHKPAPKKKAAPVETGPFKGQKRQIGDEVRFDWTSPNGWVRFTGEIVDVRKKPNPKMNMRTTPVLQYQIKTPKKPRAVWVDDSYVDTIKPKPAPAKPVEPSLYSVGPEIDPKIRLTDKGRALVMKTEAGLDYEDGLTLRELSALGGKASIEETFGSSIRRTAFGDKHGRNLSALTYRGLVALASKGGDRVYEITAKGRKALDQVHEEQDQLVARIKANRAESSSPAGFDGFDASVFEGEPTRPRDTSRDAMSAVYGKLQKLKKGDKIRVGKVNLEVTRDGGRHGTPLYKKVGSKGRKWFTGVISDEEGRVKIHLSDASGGPTGEPIAHGFVKIKGEKAKGEKKAIAPHMYVISKVSRGRYMVSLGDPREGRSKTVRTGSEADIRDWREDHKDKISDNHIVDTTDLDLVPSTHSEFYSSLPKYTSVARGGQVIVDTPHYRYKGEGPEADSEIGRLLEKEAQGVDDDLDLPAQVAAHDELARALNRYASSMREYSFGGPRADHHRALADHLQKLHYKHTKARDKILTESLGVGR